jgi:type IV secretion system protein VirB8
MKPKVQEEKDAYFKKAGSWGDDRLADVSRSRKTAWIIAMVAAAIALFEAIAIAMMMPLKTVVPYTLMVDKQTGHVQALKPLEKDEIAPNDALTQSFLVQYILAREGFSYDTIQMDYRKVINWSGGQAKLDYTSLMQASNPASPLSIMPRSTSIEARVRSVSALDKQTAMIRFETFKLYKGGVPQPPLSWVAIVKYRYSGDSMSIENRYINPLGFNVISYNRTSETPDITSVVTNPKPQMQLQYVPKQPSEIKPVPGSDGNTNSSAPSHNNMVVVP